MIDQIPTGLFLCALDFVENSFPRSECFFFEFPLFPSLHGSGSTESPGGSALYK